MSAAALESNPEPMEPSPLSSEELATRTKIIEAVKGLLTEPEWAVVRQAACEEQYAEIIARYNQTKKALDKTHDDLTRLRWSVGRLFGHFNNVMAKWDIRPLNTFAKSARSVPEAEPTGNHVPPEPEEVPPPSPVVFATRLRKRAVRKSSAPQVAPTKEIEWRRELMEKQLRLRPSTVEEILARFQAEGFPIHTPYYAERMSGRDVPRLRTLVVSDLSLLMYNGAVSREKERYRWVKDLRHPYKSRPKPKHK
jgi:hypothetical protein